MRSELPYSCCRTHCVVLPVLLFPVVIPASKSGRRHNLFSKRSSPRTAGWWLSDSACAVFCSLLTSPKGVHLRTTIYRGEGNGVLFCKHKTAATSAPEWLRVVGTVYDVCGFMCYERAPVSQRSNATGRRSFECRAPGVCVCAVNREDRVGWPDRPSNKWR